MGRYKGHVPIRTCVSCRSRRPKKELLRLVHDNDDQIIVDEFQKKNSRGIYLCDDVSCIRKFLKRKAMKNKKGFGGLDG